MGDAASKDLVGLKGLGPGEIRDLLIRARELRSCAEPVLAGCTVATLFFENSTRTRVSFTIAAQRLGASVVDLPASASSVSKGETLLDTARTIEAMGVCAMVIRSEVDHAPAAVAEKVKCSVLNAGDGCCEHPTQALADALTIADHLDSACDFDLTGLRVGIVGDVKHSRVARSNAWGLTRLGAQVTLIGPEAMAPEFLSDELPVAVSHDLDALLGSLDVVMMLRVQLERGAQMESQSDYRSAYGLTEARASHLRPGTLIMHPGPMNRGVEIDDSVADGTLGSGTPVIWDQVASGVVVRMAALESCINAHDQAPAGQSLQSRATVPSSPGRRDD